MAARFCHVTDGRRLLDLGHDHFVPGICRLIICISGTTGDLTDLCPFDPAGPWKAKKNKKKP